MELGGWKLSLALVGKHLGNLGDQVAGMIASFDPETATEVDRDRLNDKLREMAVRLATAQREYDREKAELEKLSSQITRDQSAAQILIGKFKAGEIDEKTLAAFTDELEAEQTRLPGEQEDLNQAKETLDTIQSVMTSLQQKLDDFDEHAKKALREIAQAQAEHDRAQLRLDQQRELGNITGGIKEDSSALAALSRKAEQLRVQADAANILARAGQSGVDRQDAIAKARKLAETGSGSQESALDRLQRIAGATEKAV